jgi:hypothetical protein
METTPFLPLKGIPIIGKDYHVAWSPNKGVVGRVYIIDEESKFVFLKGPKTGKPFKKPVKWSDLLHTRKQQAKIEAGHSPYG